MSQTAPTDDATSVHGPHLDDLFAALTDASSDGAWATDAAGKLLFLNPAAERLLGWRADALRGRPIHDTIHAPEITTDGQTSARSHAQEVCPLLQALQTGRSTASAEDVFRRPDGTALAVSYSVSPIVCDGQVQGAITTFRDLAAQRQTEAAHRLASIVAASDDAVVGVDRDDHITTWSPGAERLFGYSAAEALGQPITLIVPPEQHQERARLMARLERGEHIGLVEAVRRHRDGRLLDVAMSVAPLVDAAGLFTGTAAIVRDITTRKRAERELEARARQQAAVAALGQHALANAELGPLLDETVALVARTLGVDRCALLELQPDGTALLFRAVAGWPDEIVGRDLVPAGYESQAGYTLATRTSVIVDDFRMERRFRPNALLREQGVVSGMSVIVQAHGHTYGVLSVHTLSARRFNDDDVHFLEAVGHVLATAIERTRTEEQLWEGETQYRRIFEATLDGLAIITMDGIIVEANPAYCAMHGYSHDELVGLPFIQLVHPDWREALADGFTTIVTAGSTRGTVITVRKDGTVIHGEGHAALFTYMGKPHVLAVHRDVSDQIQAKEQLREKEAQYRSIFETTTDGMAIVDLTGQVVEANPACCAMFGTSYEELVDEPFTNHIHPDSLPRFAEAFATVAAGGAVQVQGLCLRKDGTPFHIESHATTLTYRGQRHVLGVVRDITERVRAEEQLREKETQYRNIFEATTDGMAIVSLDGVIVEVNPAMCEMLGYDYEDMIGRHVRTILHSDNPGMHADAVRAASTGGTNSGRGRVVRKDGSTFIGGGHGRPFLYMGAPHILSVTRDVTAEVEAYALLEQRVAERTRELSAVLDVSDTVASTLELAPLLGLILEQLQRVVDCTGSAIFIVEAEQVRVLDYRGPLPPEQMLNLRVPLAEALGYQAVAHQNGPVIVDDRWADAPLAQTFPGLRAYFEALVPYARSVLVVPLLVKEQVIGVLRIDHRAPCAYTPHHASLTMAFANHAAIAIENARLYAQAQDMAALEERQRLARELHDSVTQALYGVTLYAEAATRTLAAHDQEAATTYLREVRRTAQEALQEMRLMIFELRPPILEQEGLVAALQARLAAVEGRVPGLVTRIDVPSELRLPAPVEEALYRIAQEALNNALKHAGAQSISLSLRHEGPTVTLEISDDGAGFDQVADGGRGGFGLRGMAERAGQVGGRLAVRSAPGQGTTIRVEVTL